MIITDRHDISTSHLFPADAPPRSHGLHQSEIIKSIMCEMEPERYDQSKPMDMVKVLAGLAFERALEHQMALMHQTRFPSIIRPGEFNCDGIYGTPDGLDCGGDPFRLMEYKFTQYSARYPLTDKRFVPYLIQIKGYLRMMGLQCATLIVLFANGEYEKGMVGQPLLKAWDLNFSKQEVLENWLLLVSHARRKGMLK